MIAIVDFGMGNLGSIYNMLKYIGVESKITSDKNEIENAKKIILPGVGAFDNGMKNLESLELINLLNKKILEDKIPVLGICLGMQLFMNNSEEGSAKGLGWLEGENRKFKFGEKINNRKIPYVGWNVVEQKKENPLMNNLDSESRFYFVHSYYVTCKNENDILLRTNYGIDFASGVQKENIFGVQFHPEKSHKFGMKLLKNFSEL